MSWVLSNWLWFVWAAMAIAAAIGFVQVRRRVHRFDKADDVSPQARKHHEAEHRQKRSRSVE